MMNEEKTIFERFLHEKEHEQLIDVRNKQTNILNLKWDTFVQYNCKMAETLLSNANYLQNINKMTQEITGNNNTTVLFDKTDIKPLRALSIKDQNKLISVRCTVKSSSQTFALLTHAVYKCACGNRTSINVDTFETLPNLYGTCKDCSGKFKFNKDLSKYIDVQILEVQEPLSEIQGGLTPYTYKVLITKDYLLDHADPGMEIILTGQLHLKQTGKNNNYYTKYMTAHNITITSEQFENIKITQNEIRKIKQIPETHTIQEIANRIAPRLAGNAELKEAILLQIFGGVTHNKRGDIHLLIVGDPGTGKSQLLQQLQKITPRGIYTNGKGTSGAGLTASAVKNEIGGWDLEAGVLVLGDKGNVFIDEFEKMRGSDRNNMLEAMEQQTVSIAKAGIVTTMNSRCSILAVANPKNGRFDKYKEISDQINLPAPILSRFDLTFIIEDKPNFEKDYGLASHILNIHTQGIDNKDLSADLLRKYISYAKTHIQPCMTQEAREKLIKFYVEMRATATDEIVMPITARQLEGLIRLSEASARVRLSEEVNLEDVNRAIALQEYCMKKIGLDPETGRVDIDKVEGRISQTKRNKMNTILEVLQRLEEEFEGAVSKKILLEEIASENIQGDEAVNLLQTMKQNNVIYSPTEGKYATV